MKGYKNLPRLLGDEEFRDRHIAVERHISLDYPQHWHDYFEIEIVAEGSGTHVFNGVAYPLSKGDAYFLTPVDFHEIQAAAPMELINISFDEVWLSEDMRTALYATAYGKVHRFEGEDYQRLIMAAELLHHECEADALCIPQLLEYLLSRLVGRSGNGQALSGAQTHLTGIKKAVAYIELHFREKVTLEQLSALSGYHPAYFSELFRKFTGETFIERLTALRIQYAKALLTRGLSVADACFESGFGSLSNFLAVFKAKCGMAPSEYRKTHKKAQ